MNNNFIENCLNGMTSAYWEDGTKKDYDDRPIGMDISEEAFNKL